jgi:predicted DNA-binding protein with PD1-like motif
MKNIACFIICFLFLGTTANSQEKKPDVQVFTSEIERIEIIRMGPGTDMLEGFNLALKDKKIKNGVILSGIGSVTDYHYHVVTSRTFPVEEEDPKASVPMDLTSVQGYIMNGRVHAHITLSDENSMVGGHLEPGTKALTFFIITVGVLPENLNIDGIDRTSYKEQSE